MSARPPGRAARRLAGGLLALIVAVSSPRVDAQAAPGPVSGSVQDATGAALGGAAVRLSDAAGDLIAEGQTDRAGRFLIERVPAGTYQLRVEFAGFEPGVQTVVVAGRGRVVPTIVLAVAAVSQEVTVREEPAVVTSAANANRDAVVFSGQDLKDIPAFDRDIVATLARFLDAGSIGSGGATLVVDGMEARKVGVPPSAILAVKVNQDPYAAEFQRPGRGRIEVVTKAGSDAFHGSADFTFRDAHLNARDAFAPTRPPEQRRISEGVLGGPMFDGAHTSFLLTIERRDEDLQAIVYAAAPGGLVNVVVPRPSRGTEFSAGSTHQTAGNQLISVRVNGEFQSRRNQGVGGTTLPEAGSDNLADEEEIIVGHRWIASSRVLSEFRVLAGREVGSTVSLQPGVRIIVPDAITAGGAQADQETTEYHVQLQENVTYLLGRHLFKAGFAVPDFSRRGFHDRTNQEGTFTFASLADYEAGQPVSFVQQRGDGRMAFLQQVYGGFLQDQITVARHLSLALGVRYDWQNVLADNNNVAPRASVAWTLGDRTAIRAGIGWFYDRLGDGPIREVLRSQDDELVRYVLLDPGYPDPYTGLPGDGTTPRAIVQLQPGISTPYTVQFSAGLERQVRKGMTVSATYIGTRGVDLFRSRDVNAPPPPLYAERPDSGFSTIRQIESTARQETRLLQLLARGRMTSHLQVTAQYTLGFADNDTSGINAQPANSYDVSSEYGRADFDQRHRLELLGQFDGGPWLRLGIAVSARSGTPFSLTTGRDDYNTGQTNARPPGVRRNTLEGPGSATVDLRWSHTFAFGSSTGDERPGIEFGVAAFNVTNRVNFNNPVGNLSSPFFGQPVSSGPARRLQLSVSVNF